jgi:ATP adenylyltransferase
MQQPLWAPWRMAYIGRTGPVEECIFCAAPTGDRRDRLLLGTTPASLVMLNRYPYQSGHVMVAPRRHTASLPDLPAAEHADLAETLRRALAAVGEALAPEGFNVGMNLGRPAGAGIVDHLHVHLVPRWNGDTSFISVVGNTRVLPEELAQTAARLRPIFERLAKSDG